MMITFMFLEMIVLHGRSNVSVWYLCNRNGSTSKINDSENSNSNSNAHACSSGNDDRKNKNSSNGKIIALKEKCK